MRQPVTRATAAGPPGSLAGHGVRRDGIKGRLSQLFGRTRSRAVSSWRASSAECDSTWTQPSSGPHASASHLSDRAVSRPVDVHRRPISSQPSGLAASAMCHSTVSCPVIVSIMPPEPAGRIGVSGSWRLLGRRPLECSPLRLAARPARGGPARQSPRRRSLAADRRYPWGASVRMRCAGRFARRHQLVLVRRW
jgi:hypothetical protein